MCVHVATTHSPVGCVVRENEGPMRDPALLLTTSTKLYSVNGLRLSIATVVEGMELLYKASGVSLIMRI